MISYKLLIQDKRLAHQRNILSVLQVHSQSQPSGNLPCEPVPSTVLRPQTSPAESHPGGEPSAPALTGSPVMLLGSPAAPQQNLGLTTLHITCERFASRNRCLYLKNTQKVVWGAPYILKRTCIYLGKSGGGCCTSQATHEGSQRTAAARYGFRCRCPGSPCTSPPCSPSRGKTTAPADDPAPGGLAPPVAQPRRRPRCAELGGPDRLKAVYSHPEALFPPPSARD